MAKKSGPVRGPLKTGTRSLPRIGAAPVAAALAVVLILATVAIFGIRWLELGKIVDADQVNRDPAYRVELTDGMPAGQTFVARHDGLSGIQLYLEPPGVESHDVALTLHLQRLSEGVRPSEGVDIASAALHVPAGARPGFYRFTFAPLRHSHNVYYYGFLQASRAGVELALADAASYLDGAAYQAHEPLEAQTAFRLEYQPSGALLGAVSTLLADLGRLAAIAFLFVLPGWAVLAWLLPGNHLSRAEQLGLATGIGLALHPLLLLWTDLFGVHFGRLYAWLLPGAGLLALAVRYRKWRPTGGLVVGLGKESPRFEVAGANVALVLVLALVFGVRFLAAHSLEAPMWGDGYQHTMITQLLVDNGGLFRSWAPYAEMQTFTYHFGFHTTVAVFHWLTGVPVVDATLWIGQALNCLAVLALYPLAVRVTENRWAGVWAVVLAGLLSPMPMFYINWGRYTQLAGQVILPAAVWLTWEVVECTRHTPSRSAQRARLLLLVGLVSAGLALTHYRILIFYGAFVGILILSAVGGPRGWKVLLPVTVAGVWGSLLFLPWLVRSFGGNTPQFFGQQLVTPPSQAHPSMATYNAVGDLSSYLAPVWWLAMVLGLAVALWQRQRRVAVMGGWWLLLLLIANPAWLSLPGTGIVTNSTLFIAAYLPAALLSGTLIVRIFPIVEALLGRHGASVAQAWLAIGLTVAFLGLGALTIGQRARDVQPEQHALVTRADLRAAAWIRKQTPPDANFLVNSFFAFGGGTVVGSDGGWWLPVLAQRANTVPPLSYVSELPLRSEYRLQVLELARQVQEHGVEDSGTIEMLRREGISYVYLGQRQGQVNYSGPGTLSPSRLRASPHYKLVYRQDQVWIFALRDPE